MSPEADYDKDHEGVASRFVLGTGLIAVAGCVDAIGFLRLGTLFVSFMSGNSTRLSIALVRGHYGEASRYVAIVALFVLGGIAGRLLLRLAGRWGRPAVLSADALLLASVAIINSGSFVSTFPVVLAMGLQNTVLRNAGEIQIHLTYVTGTLVRLSEKIADTIWGSPTAWVPYAVMWLSIIIGAGVGASLYALIGLRAVALPAAAVACFAILSATNTIRNASL